MLQILDIIVERPEKVIELGVDHGSFLKTVISRG